MIRLFSHRIKNLCKVYRHDRQQGKVKSYFDYLLKEGFNKEQIDRVYSPIGEEIGAEIP
jgi:hypothetical protein